MLRDSYDVVVIGGGLAGSAAATVLGQAGARVCVLERDAFPRDKLCGEFLSGESARLLGELGALEKLMALGPAQLSWMKFYGLHGDGVQMDLPTPAFGISRRVLDDVLLQNASHAGASVFCRAEVKRVDEEADAVKVHVVDRGGAEVGEKVVRAPLVIGSYGRTSHLNRMMQRDSVATKDGYVGFKRHHRFVAGAEGATAREALEGGGEMYLLRNGYCGICRVDGDDVNVCMLLKQQEIASAGGAGWDKLTAHLGRLSPNLLNRMQGLEGPLEEPVLSVAQVPFQTRELHSGRIMFAGDAAGMIAPLCGDGQAMALESGMRLARLVLKCHGDVAELQRLWSWEWNRIFGFRMKLGRVLQPVMMQPLAARAGLAVAGRSGSLRKYITGATRGR